MINMKCKKCQELKAKYERQVEWFKEEKKQKEELRTKLNELMNEHKRILAMYFR